MLKRLLNDYRNRDTAWLGYPSTDALLQRRPGPVENVVPPECGPPLVFLEETYVLLARSGAPRSTVLPEHSDSSRVIVTCGAAKLMPSL